MDLLPINGRIVIVDDKIAQARPLMEELGKRRLSYTYYDGKPENLPEEGVGIDVRLIFLDINILDDAAHSVKELYPIIFAIMNRLIGKNSFPYVLVCWSRNLEQYEEVMGKLKEDLKERKPICSIQLSKSDFFTLTGEETIEYDEKITTLFEKISTAIKSHTPFCNLLRWENHIHNATNNALAEGLSSIASEEWDQTANWIFTKWGKAYSGKRFNTLSDKDKLRSAFHTLNVLLHETMEEEISKDPDADIVFQVDDEDRNVTLSRFNERLIFSFCQTKPKEPGRIVISPKEFADFEESLLFSFTPNEQLVPIEVLEGCSTKSQKNKAMRKYFSSIKQGVQESWDIFKLIITPPCDFAQDKVKMCRVIPGYFVSSQYQDWFKSSSDALFISPSFYYRKKESDYFFILDFRYLTSEKTDVGESKMKIKQVVLAEILSKLSRHINRQGLLTIE